MPTVEAEAVKAPGIKREPIKGGAYRAVRNPNGTWDILDVPIFAELPAGVRRNKKPIDAEWMRAAVVKNHARAAEGYLPPVHVRHHDTGSQTEPAGKLELTGVQYIEYEGRRQPAVFANLREIPAEVFARIEKGMLPYRSVEIHDWEIPEIDSLALLPDEVPFFRLALLTIGEKVEHEPEAIRNAFRSPALASACAGRGGAILFRFAEKEHVMPDPEKLADEEKPAEEEKPEEKEPEKMAEDNGLDRQILALLQAIAERIGVAAPAAAPAAAPSAAPAEMKAADPAPAPAPAPEEPKSEDVGEKAVARLSAKVDALEAVLSAKEDEARVAKSVSGALEALKGWPQDDKMPARLAKFAAKGEDILKEYVDSYKASTPKDPAETLEKFEAELAESDPDWMKEFADKSPDALSAARKHLDAYKALAGKTRLSAERYVKTALGLEGGK